MKFSYQIDKWGLSMITDNDIIVSRLGNVFSNEKLKELDKNLSELGLPIIPYDITLDEMQKLLAYQGNVLAYLFTHLEEIKIAEKDATIAYEEVYNKVYREVSNTSADHKVATLKSITAGNVHVVEAKNKILEIQRRKSIIEGKMGALEQQNVSLRKIASIKTIAISHGLE